MNTDKLFKVLVIGGALLAAGSSSAGLMQSSINTSQPQQESSAPADAISESLPVFCRADDERTCETDENGISVVKEGVSCCWGTSCGS